MAYIFAKKIKIMFVIIFIAIAIIGFYIEDLEVFIIGALPIIGGIIVGFLANQDEMSEREVRECMRRWEKRKREIAKKK
jgi:hypothetical protein